VPAAMLVLILGYYIKQDSGLRKKVANKLALAHEK
jgi:hypothetical protein